MEDIEGIQGAVHEMDVVSKVLRIKKELEDTPVGDWQMDKVTDYMLTLCNLMYGLSDLKDYAYIKAEALAEEYKGTVRDEYIKLKNGTEKITDGMAKAQAEQNCDEQKQRELKANYQARQIRSLYEDSDRLISYTQSKVKSLSDGLVRSKIERV